MKTAAWLLAFVGTLLVGVGAQTQERAVTVSGTVTDEQAAVLPGATVTLTGANRHVETTTGLDGSFRFTDVGPGTYTMTVSLAGFAVKRHDAVIALDDIHLPLTLALAPRLEHLIVSAQKREQSADEVGMAISALTGDTLRAQGIVTTRQLAEVVPGLTYAPSPFGIPVYTLRGLGNDDNESPQQAPTVGVYFDELPLPYSILTRGAFLDLERVEVLKGPQGTLFGVSTTGGAIDHIARKPTREFEAGVTLDAGRFGTHGLEAFVSGPLGPRLSGRFAFSTNQGGAWQQSVTRGDELGDSNLTSLRGQLLWTPTRAFDLRLTYASWQDSGEPIAGQVLSAAIQNPTSPARAALLQTPVGATSARRADWPAGYDFALDQAFHSLSATMNWRLTDALKLTSITGYATFDRNDMQPGTGSAVQNADAHITGTIDALSQELRVTGETADVTWIAGLHYATDDVRGHELLLLQTNTVTEFVTGVIDINTLFNESRQQTDVRGAFGQLEWTPAEAWTITLGARYTDDRKVFDGCSGDTGDGTAAALLNFNFRTTVFTPGQCTSIGPNLLPGRFSGTLNENGVSGRMGLDWTPRVGWLVYGNLSRGFKSGAFPVLAANTHSQLEPVSSEQVLAYEGGAKASLGSGIAQLNGSVFYYDYRDKQIRGSVLDPVFRVLSRLVNVPKSTVTGAELELRYQVTRRLSVAASGAWLDTAITEFVSYDRQGVLQDLAGSKFPLTPGVGLAGHVSYERPLTTSLDGFLGADVSHTGTTQGTADFVGLPQYRIDSYTLANVRAGVALPRQHWRLTAWVRNLTNEYYWQNAQRLSDYNIRWAGQPRTYGVSLSCQWR